MTDSNDFPRGERATIPTPSTTKLAAAIAAVLASAGVAASTPAKPVVQINTEHPGLKTVMEEALATPRLIPESGFLLAQNFENYAKNFENYAKNFENYAKNFENYAKNFENYGRFFENPRTSRNATLKHPLKRQAIAKLPNGNPIPASVAALRRYA